MYDFVSYAFICLYKLCLMPIPYDEMSKIIHMINSEQKEVYILGDMNMDSLRFHEH